MGVVIKQSIKGTIVNYVGVAIGFLTTFFVMTSYLTQEEVGLSRVLIDAAVLFSSFAQLGTSSSIIRFFPFFKDEEKNHHGFFFWTLVVPLLGFVIFMIVEKLFHNYIISSFSNNSDLFVSYYKFVFPLSLFMLYQSVFEANSNVLMRIVVPKFVREVGVRVGLLVLYILYGHLHVITLDGMVAGFCIVYFIAALVDFVYLLTLGKISFKPDLSIFSKPLLKDILLYTIFLIFNAITINVMPLLNTFFVSASMGLSFTGIYAISNYIATVVEVPNRSLNAIVQPNISESVKNNDFNETEKLCKSVSLHLMLSSFLIFFFIWINIDTLFMILSNGEDYEAGKSVVFILGIAKCINSTLFVGQSVLNYSKYYYYSLLFTVLLTASAVILNIVLIPRMGMNGAALSNLISYLLFFISLLFVVYVKLGINIFSIAQLKVAAITAGLWLLNMVFTKSLTPAILNIMDNSLLINIIEAVVRSSVLLLLATFVTYKWNVSNEVNLLINKVLRRQK